MALTSPGVEITIIDESQYIPAATNSVPYILLATAENKVSGAGVGVAAGTLAINANRIYLISSQRDLSATFGVPFFYKTTAGTPINGYELNEYGLLAAYSALGVSNRCYVQRVNIDLAELTASLTRPTGAPDNNTFWLDTSETVWGLFEWNQTTSAFTNKIPIVITDSTQLEPGFEVPLQSIGSIGDYAAVTVADLAHNPIYYKRGGPTSAETSDTALSDLYNTWVLLGSDEWKTAWPTVAGTLAPVSLTAGNSIVINDEEILVPNSPNNTVDGLADAINSAVITGVSAATIGGKLYIYANHEAINDGSTEGDIGIVSINNGVGTPLTSLGITPNEYLAPDFEPSYSYNAPRWRTTDSKPEPTGSVWEKINNVNLGANLVLKRYDATLGTFVQQPVPIYYTTALAIYALDPNGGGQNIPAGTTVARTNPLHNFPFTAGLEIFERYATGPMICTGTTTPSSTAFTINNKFAIQATIPGSSTLSNAVTVTLTGQSPESFCTDVSAALGQSPAGAYVQASINSAGNIVFTHSAGGDIALNPLSGFGTPITTAGFIISTTPFVRQGISGPYCTYFLSDPDFTYTASNTAPDQEPANGRLWYYSATNQADIMIQNNGNWQGYQNVSNDVRGYNLTQTNASGPIFSATPPLTQNNTALSPLVYGDLWVDTSDLENYPKLYRWSNITGAGEWLLIDNADSTTEDGILFADARWAPNGTTNPISDPIPTITSLLISNYLDMDAPDPGLYPQGTLLWNTRRGGFNVKSFEQDHFNAVVYGIDLYSSTTTYFYNSFVLYNGIIYVALSTTTGNAPSNATYWAAIDTNTWVTASGNRNDGSPYMGRQAQRALIVQALKAGIDASTGIREEQRQFNLMACPQYPELIGNMVALNNERNNTAFVVGDTPLRLDPAEIVAYANNLPDSTGLPVETSLAVGNAYTGLFYPSCQTTDLSGSPVVQPPSHMMVRTIIRSDEVAYPWLAPAGTRRGVIDNATQIGYINAQTGEFESIGVNQGLRDVLYENRINPITFVPGVGITNFGNKTATGLDTAMNRINVSRLVAFIRGRLESIAKQFLFEPNDQITRNEITNVITSMMVDLVAKRGIYDYLVVCDLTNNTPARIDRNELYVDIAIEPVKAVEFIYIPVRIKNTGEIASQSV